MTKRIILCPVVLCLLLILPCSGLAEDTLDELYSASNAFLNEHYGATVEQAEEFAKLEDEIKNARPSPITGKNVYSLEDYAPDLAERFEVLLRKKYPTQPPADRALGKIIINGTPVVLWRLALSQGSDVEITSVELSLRNTDIRDKRNDIIYTVNLLINETNYEVIGVLGLALVDGKWQIDAVQEFGWSPFYPKIKH